MRSADGYQDWYSGTGWGSVVTPALLEREYECETLARALAAAADGAGSILALEGEAGMGKTSLLAHAARCSTDRGMRVLDACGTKLERNLAYGIVRQLFEPELATATKSQRACWLAGAASLAAPVVSAGKPVKGSGPDRGPILRGLYWLTANLASEQPLLLIIDDAHWADTASMAFASHLARRVEELPILIVYASRTGEGASEALPAVAEPSLVRTVLRPVALSEAASQNVLRERLARSSSYLFARACHYATMGNPFLLTELVRTLAADGIVPDDASARCVEQIEPTTIARDRIGRLRRLDEAANELAFAVAVLGRRAGLRQAAALAGLEEDVAAAAADALAGAAIFHDGRPLDFSHPIVRSTVYEHFATGRRAAGHKRAARLLAADGVDDVVLAPHLLATAPAGDAWVVERLCRAAQAAAARGAGEASYTYLERASREPPAPQVLPYVLLSLGSAALQLAKPEAVDHLKQALHCAPETGTRLAAAQELTRALACGGRLEDALELGRQVLASLPPDDEEALRFEGRLAALGQFSPAIARSALERLERYENRLIGETTGERLVLAALAFHAANRGASAVTTADFARRALADGRLLHDDGLGGPNFFMAVAGLLRSDRLEEAEHQLDLALEAARAQGSEAAFGAASGLRCQALLRRGRLRQAEGEALGVLAQVAPDAVARPMLLASLITAMLERADPVSWEPFLVEHRIDRDLPGLPDVGALLVSRAQMRLAAGDARAALRDLDQLRRDDERSGLYNPWTPSRACRALAYLQLGQRDAARASAAEELARAGRWGTPSALAGALRTTAIVQGGDESIELLRASVRAVEHSPARYELARSLAALGSALRRAGHPHDARPPLRRALDLADDCGAERLARVAREELVMAGARPRRALMRGCDTLTPSERRIAQLAAEGHASHDIAQALFATVRTVETHLSHVYAELDVASPDRLAAALHTYRPAVRTGVPKAS